MIRPDRLRSLTGLRFLAAFIVFLSHATGPMLLRTHGTAAALQKFTGQGYVGVSFFFILSGFVMAWSHRDGDRPSAFWRRRIARVVPAYWVALVAGTSVGVAVSGAVVSEATRALPSVLLLQAWFPSASIYYAGNGVGWSLAVEALFYALFPLLIRWCPRTTRACLCAAGAFIAWPVLVAAIAHPVSQGSLTYWLVYILPIERLAEFALGIILARAIQLGWTPPVNLVASALLSLAACAAVAFTPYWATFVAITIVPFALLIAASAHADLFNRPSWFRARWLVRLGEWSFAFYLVHQIVVRVVEAASKRLGPPSHLSDTLSLFVSLALSVAGAAALYYLVERPAERRLRGARPRPEMAA